MKPGAKVSLLGNFEPGFLDELGKLTKAVRNGKVAAGSESIFFAADSKPIVYPKGQKHITENDVLSAGRKAGLKDVKVVGFSATHTALKFVIPLADR
ncbi:MAG: hypothetical protein DMG49_19320 [Acidobacteria bacterium]|nr:MAG: hypothetical protein DMG49_19320 [Acidobacteriota bacterium]